MADAYDTELDNLRRKILKKADEHIENSVLERTSKHKCLKLRGRFNELLFQNKQKEDKLNRLRVYYTELQCRDVENCTLKGKSLNELRQNFASKPLSVGNQQKLLSQIILQIHSYQKLQKKEESESQRLSFMRARKSSLSRSFTNKLSEADSIDYKFKDLGKQILFSKHNAYFQWLKGKHELQATHIKYIKNHSDRNLALHSSRKQEKKLKEKVSRVATSLAKSTLCLKNKRLQKQAMIKSIKQALQNRSLYEKSLIDLQSQLQSFQEEFAALRTVVNMIKKGNTPADMTEFINCVFRLWHKMKTTENQLKSKYGEICNSHCKLSLELEDLKHELQHTNAGVEVFYKLNKVKSAVSLKSITSNQIHDIRLKHNGDTQRAESYERICIQFYSFFQEVLGRIKKQIKVINVYALNNVEVAINTGEINDNRRTSTTRHMNTARFSELDANFTKVKKQTSCLSERNHKEALANDISSCKVIADILAPNRIFGYKLSEILQLSELFKLFLIPTDLCKILRAHTPVSELSFTVILKTLYERTLKNAKKSTSKLMDQVQDVLDFIGKEKSEPMSRAMQSVKLKTDKKEARKLLKMVLNVKQKIKRREKKLKNEDTREQHHRFKISSFAKITDPADEDRERLLKSNRSVRTKNIKHQQGIPKIIKLNDFSKDLLKIKNHVKVLKSTQANTTRVLGVSPL